MNGNKHRITKPYEFNQRITKILTGVEKEEGKQIITTLEGFELETIGQIAKEGPKEFLGH